MTDRLTAERRRFDAVFAAVPAYERATVLALFERAIGFAWRRSDESSSSRDTVVEAFAYTYAVTVAEHTSEGARTPRPSLEAVWKSWRERATIPPQPIDPDPDPTARKRNSAAYQRQLWRSLRSGSAQAPRT